jgi:hypothetical protein
MKQLIDHSVEAISRLAAKPAVIGHSFGGLITRGAGTETAGVDSTRRRTRHARRLGRFESDGVRDFDDLEEHLRAMWESAVDYYDR